MDTIDHDPPPFWRSPTGVALLVVAVVGGFELFTEHRAHVLGVLGVLPYAFLLACPLTHMFMHRSQTEMTDDERPRQ